MKRTRTTLAILSLPLIYVLTGCYPNKIDYVDEYDLAATVHDEKADFSVFTTFSIIDTIVHVTEDGEEDPNLDRSNDRFILNELRSNMLDMGYSEIESPDSIDNRPDLLLTVSALSADFTYYYS